MLSALSLAAYIGSVHVAQMLVDGGASVNHQDSQVTGLRLTKNPNPFYLIKICDNFETLLFVPV